MSIEEVMEHLERMHNDAALLGLMPEEIKALENAVEWLEQVQDLKNDFPV